MNQKILGSIFLVFLLSSCQFFGGKKEFVPFDSELSQTSAFDQSLQLDLNYINHFRLDGFIDPGQESKYLTEKEKLVQAYNKGDRSLNLLRAYIYLTGLE